MAGRTLTIYVDADTKKATQELGAFESAISGIGKAAMGFVAGAAALDFMQQAVTEAAAAAESQSKFADAIGRTSYADQIAGLRDYNAQLSELTGYDDDLIADAGAILSRFTNDAEALKKAEAAAADYAAATGKSLPEAATALGQAAMGNTRALKALGIDYKATGDRAADFANVVKLVDARVGGTASMDTAARSLRSLETTYGDLQEKIGDLVLPVLDDAADGFSHLVAAIEPTLTAIEQMISGFDGLKDAFDGLDGLDLPDWMDDMQDFMSSTAFVSQFFGPFAGAVQQAQASIDANREALEAAGYTYDDATGQIKKITTAAAQAAPSVEDLTDAVTSSAQSFRTYRSAVIEWKAAVDAGTKAANDNTGAVNKQRDAFVAGTEKGRAAEQSMIDLAEATEKAWKAATDEGKHQRAKEILQEGREQLTKQGEKWGLTEDAAADYAAEVLAIPDSVTTNALFNADAARRAMNALIDEYKRRFDQVGGWFAGTGGSSRSAGPSARSLSAGGYAAAPVTVNVTAGVGDPVAIGQEIERVIATRRYRTGAAR